MNSEIIKDLKRNLEDIYTNFRERIDQKAWQRAIERPYKLEPRNTSVQVVDFLRTHDLVPAACVRAACNAIDLKNNPVEMSNIYSEKIILDLFRTSAAKDPLRYAHIPADLGDDELRRAFELADEYRAKAARGQIYLAGKALNELKKYCGSHPEVKAMQLEYDELCIDGGMSADSFAAEIPEKKEQPHTGDTSELTAFYESEIADDYKNFYAYQPLGELYLEAGEEEKADYMADTLLDFGYDAPHAMLLKGKVLEKKGKVEEAFFYYKNAFDLDTTSAEAAENAKRLLAVLDENSVPGVLWEVKEDAEPFDAGTFTEKPSAEILSIVENTDTLIKQKRMTEAYYELVKKSNAHPESYILQFKKAFILYLMKREIEARIILADIPETSPVYENAASMIEDIDWYIKDNNKFEDIPQELLAEIFFHTDSYTEAIKACKKISTADMSAKLWAIKGRAEIQLGQIKAALKSFRKALEINDSEPHVRELMGMIYQFRGENEKALDMYTEAIDKEKEKLGPCGEKGSLLYTMERNEELLLFREDAYMLTGVHSDVDGYAGIVYVKGYPRSEENGLRFLENAMLAGTKNIEFYITAVNEFIKKKDLQKALIYTEKGLAHTDNARELYMKKAEILYLLGKLEPAETIACILLAENPDSAEIQYLLGNICSDRGRDKDAIKWYQSASDLEPGNHKFAYAIADKCFDTSDMGRALKYYTRAIGLNPGDIISLKRRALIYADLDEDEKALADLAAAIKIDKNDPEVYVIIGNIIADYVIEDNTDLSSEDVMDDATSDDTQPDSEADGAEGTATSASDFVDASADAAEGTATSATDSADAPDSAADQGDLASGATDPAAASDDLATDTQNPAAGTAAASTTTELAEPDAPADAASPLASGTDGAASRKSAAPSSQPPAGTAAQSSYSEPLDLMKDIEKDSEYYYNKALALDPSYRQGYICRAKFFAEDGRTEEAMADIDKAIALDPDSADAYMVRGIIYHLIKDNDSALKDFETVADIEKDNALVYSYMAKCLNASANYKRAIGACEKGLAIDPDFLNLYVNRGVSYFSLEMYSQAVEDFRRVIMKKNVVNTAAVESAYRFRGMAYERMGKNEEAMNDYRMVMKYNPDIADIRKRLDRLESEYEASKAKEKKFSFFKRKKH